MAGNPLNLSLRFVLELVALGGLACLGWVVGGDGWRVVPAVVLPVAAAAAWGTFRIPHDPGRAPVPVSGPVRLTLEIAVFAGGVAGYVAVGCEAVALVVGAVMVGHCVASYDRVLRLLRKTPAAPQS